MLPATDSFSGFRPSWKVPGPQHLLPAAPCPLQLAPVVWIQGRSFRRGLVTVRAAQVKRRKEPALDRVIEQNKKLKLANKVAEVLLRQDGHRMSLRELGKYRHQIGLSGGRRCTALLQRFPGLFRVHDEGAGNVWFTFTPQAQRHYSQERALRASLEELAVAKVCKVLMMSPTHCLRLQTIGHVWREFGLPADFRTGMLQRHPEHFQVVERENDMVLQLKSWDPLLAVSAVELQEQARQQSRMTPAEGKAPMGGEVPVGGEPWQSAEGVGSSVGKAETPALWAEDNILPLEGGVEVDEMSSSFGSEEGISWWERWGSEEFDGMEGFDERYDSHGTLAHTWNKQSPAGGRTSRSHDVGAGELELENTASFHEVDEEQGRQEWPEEKRNGLAAQRPEMRVPKGEEGSVGSRSSGTGDVEDGDAVEMSMGVAEEVADLEDGEALAARAMAAGKSKVKDASSASIGPEPAEETGGLAGDAPPGHKWLRLPPGLRLPRRAMQHLRAFHSAPLVSPYACGDGDGGEYAPSSLDAERRWVAVIHELLSLTVEKRLLVDHLTHFRRDLRLTQRIYSLLVRHPEYFYVSAKGVRHSVFLREAYYDGMLIEKDELAGATDKLRRLARARHQIMVADSEAAWMTEDYRASGETDGLMDHYEVGWGWEDGDNVGQDAGAQAQQQQVAANSQNADVGNLGRQSKPGSTRRHAIAGPSLQKQQQTSQAEKW